MTEPRAETGTAEHGRLDLDGPDPVLRFVRHLDHPPEKVWRALTEPTTSAAGSPPTSTANAGRVRRCGSSSARARVRRWTGRCSPTSPTSLLELQWGDDEVLRFELTPTDDGRATELRFANTLKELGKAARDGAGWHHCLDNLAHDLDGHDKDDDRWRQVQGWYVDHLPPEASTIGPPPGQT